MKSSLFSGFGYAKALIFGEYAVMHGAPALVMALSNRLILSLDLCRVSGASGFEEKLTRLLFDKFGFAPQISIDNSAFYDDFGHKIGIGSSAAAIVALVDAVNKASEFTGLKTLSIMDAICLHRALQGQMGSGIDVIASACGGFICARNCPHHPVISRIPSDNLPHFAILATHQPAPTCNFIAAAKKVENTAVYRSLIQEMTELCSSLSDAVQKNGNIRFFIEQIRGMTALLHRLEVCIDRRIIPQNFDNLCAFARDFEVTLKTSGAGGGDILIAMAEDEMALNQFKSSLPQCVSLVDSPLAEISARIPCAFGDAPSLSDE